MIPAPRFGVDGFPHAAQNSERGAGVLVNKRVSAAHEGANGGGCGVKNGDAMGVDHIPATTGIWKSGHAFKDDLRGAAEHGTVSDVGMACKLIRQKKRRQISCLLFQVSLKT